MKQPSDLISEFITKWENESKASDEIRQKNNEELLKQLNKVSSLLSDVESTDPEFQLDTNQIAEDIFDKYGPEYSYKIQKRLNQLITIDYLNALHEAFIK